MYHILLSPPLVMMVCLALAYGLYWVGGALGARGADHPGKHQPYACGEDLLPPRAQLAYHAFFRLALMFGILHLAALIMSTLPMEAMPHRIALIYLGGIALSMWVLTGREA